MYSRQRCCCVPLPIVIIIGLLIGGCHEQAGRQPGVVEHYPDEVVTKAAQAVAAFATEVPTVPDEGPNQLLHRYYAIGRDYPIRDGDGQADTCLTFLFTQASSKAIYGLPVLDRQPAGWTFFRPRSSRLRTNHQAHANQFMLLLSADRALEWSSTYVSLPIPDQPDISLQDLLQSAKAIYHAGTDGSWLLAALAQMKHEDPWTNRFGESWSIDSLVQHELAWESLTAPCWGQHRLYGLACAADQVRDCLARGTARSLDDLLAREANEAWGRYDRSGGGFIPHDGPLRDDLQFSYNAHVLEWMLACPATLRAVGGARLHDAILDLADAAATHTDAPTIVRAHAIHALRVYSELASGKVGGGNRE
ncbi:MAG: hypothetical protein D8M59_15690 [Planctomycetes bacterium]|nr:hypothetical protein [Planctomycetota bacterium]NOG54899.1 hypothetical protein [Planctomycetota bacterium]